MPSLRILHCHDSDLDDHRIINAARTGIKNGYETYFCGMPTNQTLEDITPFGENGERMRWLGFSDRARFAYNPFGWPGRYWYWQPYPRYAMWQAKLFKRVVDEVRPDIIHAHNIFAAFHCMDLGVPMVLDDHELYSLHLKVRHGDDNSPIVKKLMRKYGKVWMAGLYEQKIADKGCPIIVVSNQAGERWNEAHGTSKTFTVPNYPMSDYIKHTTQFKYSADSKTVNSFYLGADPVSTAHPLRDIQGMHDIFDKSHPNTGKLVRAGVVSPVNDRVRAYGLLPMQDAYSLMQEKAHIGLIPWKQHWFHKYCVPNKAAEYGHCGLLPIFTKSITPIVEDYGSHCDTIETMADLVPILEKYNADRELLDKRRLAAAEHAKQQLIWERVEDRITDAYKQAK